RGYGNGGELTAERFAPNPMSGAVGERLYRTGDLAVYLPDGNLRCLGRTDHQIKVRGYRIEPGEIEAELSSYAEVEQAVVVAREWRGGEKRLGGYVVAAAGHSIDFRALRQRLAQPVPGDMGSMGVIWIEGLAVTACGEPD